MINKVKNRDARQDFYWCNDDTNTIYEMKTSFFVEIGLDSDCLCSLM